MVKRFIIFLTCSLLITALASASTDTSTRIFDRRFRTLKVENELDFMALPVIRMGTEDRITVKFDEIGEDNSWLEYRLVHCNSDWQPSRLLESEYVEGFNSARVEDFAFSSATFVHYVNYLITIPNEDMRILHSGNYLLQVYDPDSPEEVLLQARFQVSENAVRADGGVTSRTDRGHYGEWQQVALSIDTEGMGPLNPYQDLTVTVEQNNREATRRVLRTPQRLSGTTAVYEHQPELIFPASNEYRRFESVSNSFAGMHVDSLRYMGSNYHVWLKPDSERASAQYSYDQTQHGRFKVHEYNATDPDVGADYVTVHFTLEMPELKDRDVYVDGEFTHGGLTAENRMKYDPWKGAYTAEFPLKQGAYNYQYVTVAKGSLTAPETARIEGNKYETQNEYTVSVYYHPPGSRGERLISNFHF